VLDATGKVEEVQAAIWRAVEARLRNRGGQVSCQRKP